VARVLPSLLNVRRAWLITLLATFSSSACSSSNGDGNGAGGGAASPGAGTNGAGASGPVFGAGGGNGTSGSNGASGSSGAGAGPDFQSCTGVAVGSEQAMKTGPLDIYLIFDRTASMGQDCAFTPGTSPPVASKACYATYAVAEFFMGVNPANDTRLAFQFMSLASDDCNGGPYATPLIDMTQLPVDANHPLVQAISNETFVGGLGTHIEGAIRGLSQYTIQHDKTVGAPAGRTTIGILMTDGDPNGCDENIADLTKLVSDHAAASGGAVKLFFIGETGATLANLESYAVPGGAAPHPDFCGNGGPNPCHYWDVGNGDPAAFASVMASIVGQATVSHPIPCTFDVPPPPAGQTLNPSLVNVQFSTAGGQPARILRVDSASTCDPNTGGWYYDNPTAPKQVILCQSSCSNVAGQAGANVAIEFGCASQTMIH